MRTLIFLLLSLFLTFNVHAVTYKKTLSGGIPCYSKMQGGRFVGCSQSEIPASIVWGPIQKVLGQNHFQIGNDKPVVSAPSSAHAPSTNAYTSYMSGSAESTAAAARSEEERKQSVALQGARKAQHHRGLLDCLDDDRAYEKDKEDYIQEKKSKLDDILEKFADRKAQLTLAALSLAEIAEPILLANPLSRLAFVASAALAAKALQDMSVLEEMANNEKIFHRKESTTQTPEDADKIEKSGELWGKVPREGDRPTAQAYAGPLPPGARGVEFDTDVSPDTGCRPHYPSWSGPRDGVEVDDEFAKIKIRVRKNTQKGKRR